MTTHLNPTFIDGAVLHVPSIFIVSRNKKKYQDFSDEISNFTAEKKKKKKKQKQKNNLCMLHGQVFVMTSQYEMPHWKIKDVHRRKQRCKAFVFATRIVKFVMYLNPKFQASSYFLCLYRSVCVGPVCWFSHVASYS